MPTVAPPAKILVTGASGYLAVHTVVALVERGYNVVGTVRTPAKGEYVKNLVKKNFEYVLVPDIEAPGAFDEAVKGVDAIEHSASPVEMPAGDPQPIITATVGAIVNVLEAAKKHGPTVKRIVYTSSTAAVSSDLFEENYNDAAVAEVEENGADAHPVSKYSAAKVLSERAAWDFISKNKGNIGFDLVIAVPPFLFGPHIQENPTFAGHFALGGLDPAHPKTGDELTQVGFFYLDVRDCATILAELLAEEKASNERLILIAGPWTWQAIYQALNAPPALQGVPSVDLNAKIGEVPKYSTKYLDLVGKSHHEAFRPFNETFRDLLLNLRQRGWAPEPNGTPGVTKE